MLFGGRQGTGISLSWKALGLALFLMGTVAVALAVLARRVMSRKSKSGAEGLVGMTGMTATALEPDGTVQIHSEIWNAQSVAGPIAAQTRVEVVSTAGLTLRVRPAKS
jgi:membrane-bound serine protease (ClpP class)